MSVDLVISCPEVNVSIDLLVVAGWAIAIAIASLFVHTVGEDT